MANPISVLIDLIARDKATPTIKKVRGELSALRTSGKHVTTQFPKLDKELTEFTRRLGPAYKGVAKIGWKLSEWGSTFRMQWLSIMFGGMMIQRTFERIKDAGVSTFTKIMEASEIHTTAIQRLNIAWEYLKFTIGSAINTALMPLLPTIMNVINSIAQWINQHPKLVFWLIALMVVLGTVMFYVGSFALLLGGAAKVVGGLILSLSSLWVKLSKVIGLFGKVGPILLWVAAVAYLIGYVIYLSKKLGGLLNVGKAVVRGLLRFFALLAEGVSWIFVNIVKAIISAINYVIDKVNSLIRSINRKLGKFGIHIGTIGKIGLPGWAANYTWGSAVLDEYFRFEEKYLGLGTTGGIAAPWETSWMSELFGGGEGGQPQVQNNININVSGVVSSDFADELARMLDERLANIYSQNLTG